MYLYTLNFPNGKRYIGISINPERRFKYHQGDARRGSNLPVHRALRKYSGRVILKILRSGTESEIKALEISYIKRYKTRTPEFGYNVSEGGDISPSKTEAVRKKLSISMRGAKNPRYGKPGTMLGRTGPLSGLYGKKGSDHPAFGYRHTEEAKRRISRKGPDHPMWGKPRPDETRKKLSLANQGKSPSLESLAKMREHTPKGENHPHSKLTLSQVVSIRTDTRSSYKLSEIYGVSRKSIRNIQTGKTWKSALT